MEQYLLKFSAIFYLFLLSLLPNWAFAENHQSLQTSERRLEVTVFSAVGQFLHPAVILLHGYQCIEACASDFERYALALAEQGIDTYVLKYYNDSDISALDNGHLDGDGYAARFHAWTVAVREAIELIRAQPLSNGRVALIGFSQGGRLAIASAANNPSISALVVFYARLPTPVELSIDIRKLPPLLLLHGGADTVVPLRDGNAVFAKAQLLGAQSEMVVYPNAGHGFDFSADNEMAIDARRHVLAFLRSQIVHKD